jgi:putative transposase
VAVAGANVPDFQVAEATLLGIVVERPDPDEHIQHLCADRGYDFDEVHAVVFEQGYVPHIPPRGQPLQPVDRAAGQQPRRWVVERTHAWLNRFRRLLVRWEKKPRNFLALLHLACATLVLQRAGLLR